MGSKTANCGLGGVAGFFSKYSKIKVQEACTGLPYVFFAAYIGHVPSNPADPAHANKVEQPRAGALV